MTPPTYADWITAYLAVTPVVRGQCAAATAWMQQSFPELRRTCGFVTDAREHRAEHWWCVAPDGSIVDPTASQYFGIETYEEYRAGMPTRVGKCADCGEYIWGVDGSALYGGGFCNEACATRFMEYLNGDDL